MKKLISIIISIFFLQSIIAQSNKISLSDKIFNKLVIDIGASPFSKTFDEYSQLSTYNFSLGYQLFKKADIRMNLDYLNINKGESWDYMNLNVYNSLFGMSLGFNVKLLNEGNYTFFKNKSLGIVGKFGAAFSVSRSEQEAMFYDISTRIYFGKVPYFGIGLNQLFNYGFSSDHLTSLYFTFGIDF